MPSSGLPVSTKKSWPKTRVDAVAKRKNSYHSTTVPAIEAATTFFSPPRFSGESFGSADAATLSSVLMWFSSCWGNGDGGHNVCLQCADMWCASQ